MEIAGDYCERRPRPSGTGDSAAAGGWVSVERLLSGARRWDGAVWTSGAMDRMMALVRRLEPRRAVLVRGASGVGKSMVVQALHEFSAGRGELCVVVDCTTLDRPRGEEMLFSKNGEKGGYLSIASRGSLVLDHASELPFALQRRLARILGGVSGAERGAWAMPRVIAVSNRDLGAMMGRGRFSPELYAILSASEIVVPPLSERREDIAPLVGHLVSQYNIRTGRSVRLISARALETLSRYSWPGNVRELRNVVENAVLLGDGERVDLTDLDVNWADTGCGTETHPSRMCHGRERTLDRAIREVLVHSLREASGDSGQAAEMLGVSRSDFGRLLGRYSVREHDWQAA